MTAGQPPSTHSHRVGSTTRPSARVTASRTSFSVCRYGLASRSGVVQALTSSRCAATQSGPGSARYGVSFKNTIDRAAPCSWFMVEAIPAPQFDEVWPLIAKARREGAREPHRVLDDLQRDDGEQPAAEHREQIDLETPLAVDEQGDKRQQWPVPEVPAVGD